jgi:hypothetical protein
VAECSSCRGLREILDRERREMAKLKESWKRTSKLATERKKLIDAMFEAQRSNYKAGEIVADQFLRILLRNRHPQVASVVSKHAAAWRAEALQALDAYKPEKPDYAYIKSDHSVPRHGSSS